MGTLAGSDRKVVYRLLGLLPLAFFGARLAELIGGGEAAHIFWMCHMSNLLIGLGLLWGAYGLVRVSVLWLIIGAPLWPLEIMRTGVMEVSSIGTHYAGLVVGLLALRQMGMGRRSWLYAWLWFLGLQAFCRLFTPADFNVNLAHSIYPGWEWFFAAYWQYWVFTTMGAAAGLWLIGKGLRFKISPPRRKGREDGSATPDGDGCHPRLRRG